jgi:predicted ATPase
LTQHGILVLLSSNLGVGQIHLAPDHVIPVELKGLDHRRGELAQVCLPNVENEWFDLFEGRDSVKTKLLAGASVSTATVAETTIICLRWDDLRNRPLLKDDFARFFKNSRADFVLLEGVPFFTTVTVNDIDLNFLGQLFRFVNFVDAIHDCRLPLLVRGAQPERVDDAALGQQFRSALMDYDERRGGTEGQAAWIEWSRCLSRLRSREALNEQIGLLIATQSM